MQHNLTSLFTITIKPSNDCILLFICSEKRRLSLSIKQLQNDPLLETLDMILPAENEPTAEVCSIPAVFFPAMDCVAVTPFLQESRSLEASYASVPLFGLDEICKELEMEPRQAPISSSTTLSKITVCGDLCCCLYAVFSV